MANSTHCLLVCAGPKAQVQAFRDLKTAGPSEDLSVFKDPANSVGHPFFHRIYNWTVPHYSECVQPGDAYAWRDLSLWQPLPGHSNSYQGSPSALTEAATVAEGEALVEVVMEFRVAPPPVLLHLASMYPDCRWRLQMALEGTVNDWGIADDLAELVDNGLEDAVLDDGMIDVRALFDRDTLQEALHIGSMVGPYGVTNGVRLWRKVPTKLCQRVLSVDPRGPVEVVLPDGRMGAWVVRDDLNEAPARSLVFGWTAAATLAPFPLKTDDYLGTGEDTSTEPGPWFDFADGDYEDIPFCLNDGSYTEMSDDFDASVEDFEGEALRLLTRCDGEIEKFEAHAKTLMGYMTAGTCLISSITCENEATVMDLEFGPGGR